jgi:hypothetical protein
MGYPCFALKIEGSGSSFLRTNDYESKWIKIQIQIQNTAANNCSIAFVFKDGSDLKIRINRRWFTYIQLEAHTFAELHAFFVESRIEISLRKRL